MGNYKDKSGSYKVKKFLYGVMIFTWVPWLFLVFSGREIESMFSQILIGLGGIAPTSVTLYLLLEYHSKSFSRDFFNRLLSLNFARFMEAVWILFPVFASVLSIAISIGFLGGLWEQLNPGITISQLIPFAIFVLLFGPLPEELGWRGYLLDGLAEKWNPFYASLIIGVVWGIWHLPLFFIEGYPLTEYAASSTLLIVYFGSLIPKSIIMTYIYFKTDRSILTAVLFHFLVNFMGMYLNLSPSTEVIQFIIFVLGSLLIMRDKRLFFQKIQGS